MINTPDNTDKHLCDNSVKEGRGGCPLRSRGFALIVASVVLALGLWLMGVMICRGLGVMADKSRTVSVRGLAVREVPADEVIWPVVIRFGADNLNDISSTMSRSNNAIISFLKANGITDNEISVGAPTVVDTRTNTYGSNSEPFIYNVTGVITVTSKDVDKVNKAMLKQGELLDAGVAVAGGGYEYSPTYNFNGLNAIKPAMIEESTKNAREAARKFAKDSDSKLGKIRNASQGQFEITDRDQYTPWIKEVRVVSSIVYQLDD